MSNKFDLAAYGVAEMSKQELVETDGGLWWLIIPAAALLFGGCVNSNNRVEITVEVARCAC